MEFLIDEGFLEEISDLTGTSEFKQYRFPHALTQEVVYASIHRRNRAEMHVRIGEALGVR